LRKKHIMENKNNMNNIIQFLFGFQRRLSNIIRFNTRPRTTDETVAEHSFFVALYVLILAEVLDKKGVKIDKLKAVRRALLHDLEECVAGDVMTHVKDDGALKRAYDKIALVSVNMALDKLPTDIKDFFTNEWIDFNKGESNEDWLVDVADDVSGIVYCKEQMNLGNKYFDIILTDYLSRLGDKVRGTDLEDFHTALLEETKVDSETKLDVKYDKTN